MTDPIMMIPMRRNFCIDLIRYSDGFFTPETIGEWAEQQVLDFLERTYDQFGTQWFDERALEFAEDYFPHIAEEWLKQDADALASYQKETKPLVWKEVTVTHRAGVRMHYGEEDHYAEVKNGRIVDETGIYSPSEWASKVAGGTSRNAWRDLWFKELLARTWVPAQLLRDQARSELRARRDDEAVVAYDTAYTFSAGGGGGVRRSLDPVVKEARAIARGMIAIKMKEAGRKMKELDKAKLDKAIDKWSEHAEVLKAAEKVVKEREALANISLDEVVKEREALANISLDEVVKEREALANISLDE